VTHHHTTYAVNLLRKNMTTIKPSSLDSSMETLLVNADKITTII